MEMPRLAGGEPGDSPGSDRAGGRPDGRMRARGSRVIGRYRLVDQVGEPAGCKVWKAFDEVLRRPVAMLTFAPGAADAGEVVAAAGAASRVGDVRFAHVFDAADDAEGAYVVTEWPSGESLEDLVADGPLEVADAVWIVAEVAGALSAAHAAGVAHLRLSPRAVRWNPEGGVKITGLAVDAALASTRRDDGALADTRALAALLYAALTSRWPGEEETTLASAPTRRRDVYPPRQVQVGIPGRIDAIICRALLPQSRRGNPPITHPAQLAAALLEEIVRAPLSARSHTGRARPNAPRWPRRPRSGTVILSGGALVLAAAVAFGDSISGRTLALNAGGVPSPASHPSSRRASARAKPPARSPTLPAVGRLAPLAARSFDPSGDDGFTTAVTPDGSPSHVWRTHGYTTAHFGNLRTGTGLLLDMGRPGQITNVRITLGTAADADLQVRIAASTTFEHAFRTVARAPHAAGATDLTIGGPAPGRYVLIWFTRLPPTSNGDVTFQASIHALTLYGLRA
ncbi:serine/threonine protein kinase [Actinoallomurus sp. NPDC050550]|uniref:serine/threonine protein kinase n=1 Tax=Actinoallomurus sp. NPDC050550 TaxID=3154937 RepID=UPI0033EAFDF2